MACWSTKAAIFLKRVKIEEKLQWRAYRKSQTLFRTVPSRTTYGFPFPKIGGSQPHPKPQSLLSQERLKLRILNLAVTFINPSEQKPIKIFGEKGAWAYPGTAHIFGILLLSQERVKLRTSNFARTFTGSMGTNLLKFMD